MRLFYAKAADLYWDTQQYPKIITSEFLRGIDGYLDRISDVCIIYNKKDVTEALLNCVPVLGTIRGLVKLHNLWGLQDRSKDDPKRLVFLTVCAVLETLGLGIVLLILKLICTFFNKTRCLCS
ncbi:hypothetical protein [Chlamydia vaughanii]|uniref:hypothetical protein n=1 Tax=Chlamydia vaughanii TaxID=3112552 RepID=UPI0032B17544